MLSWDWTERSRGWHLLLFSAHVKVSLAIRLGRQCSKKGEIFYLPTTYASIFWWNEKTNKKKQAEWETSLISVWPGSFQTHFASDFLCSKDNFSQNMCWIMVWVQFSGNKSKEMLQIFELSYSQMANRYNSAHSYLLFLTIWKNNASQHILALNLLIKSSKAEAPVSQFA